MATRHSSPSLTTRVLVGGIATVVVLLGATVVSYGLFSMIASPAAPAPASPTPAVALGAIAGRVWHDLCAVDTSHQGAASAASTGCVLSAGGEVQADGAFEPGEPPLAGASVVLGAGACPATPLKETFVLSDGTFVLSDLPPGNYCVSLNAEAQPLQLTPGRWTTPANAAGSPVALIDIALGPGEVKGGADFGWDYQFLPIPEAQPSPAPSPAASPPACTDRAAYLGDVTIPDGTWVLPGASFEKIWRIQNLGTCTWNSAYVLAFVSGQSMGAAEAAPLLSAVGPGGIADLSVRLTAPLSPGTYRGNWMLRDPSGAFFGIGPDAASAFWVIVNVGDTSTGAGPWRGEYFNNRGLSGSPAVIRDDAVIDFDWQLEAPASGIAADDFSVRWTAEIPFEGGTYDMHLTFDDGARLWIDDEKVFDEWRDGARRERVVTVPLVQGSHDLRLEYYEHAGDARVRLNWSPVTHFADWKGEYFANRDLRGSPALIRNDRDVDFSWGRGSAAEGLPADGFSARWKRTISFDRGRYRLFATADDGVRVFVDGGKVLDEWHESSGSQVYTVDIDLAGRKTIVVEYYERSGQANVHFWFERLVPTPTSTASVTISPTTTWTPTATETAPPSPTPSPTVSPTASESPTPSPTPTPSETPTEAPTATATCVPIECGPIIPPG